MQPQRTIPWQARYPRGTDLTGMDLGGQLILTPGVYTFTSTAQLTGALTLNFAGSKQSEHRLPDRELAHDRKRL